MTNMQTLFTPLHFQKVLNARTYTNIQNNDGLMLRGNLIVRSARWDQATDADFARLQKMNVVNMVDLRLPFEFKRWPDLRRNFINYYSVPLQSDDITSKSHTTKTLVDRFNDNPNSFAVMENGYQRMVEAPESQQSLAKIFTVVFANEGGVLFHCSMGKDRTGLSAALLLRLLNIDWHIVVEDYLYSNVENADHIKDLLSNIRAAGGDETACTQMSYLAATHVEYLQAAFNWIKANYGTVDNYMTQALKLEPELIEHGKAKFLVQHS